jgi:excisionase family DNA binding protein
MTEVREVLTEKQAAELLQMGHRTLRKLTERGQIPSTRLGRQRRYLRSEVLKALTPRDGAQTRVSGDQNPSAPRTASRGPRPERFEP